MKFFKMIFLVRAIEDPPYDILIGLNSICEHRTLFAPTLITILPPVPRKKDGATGQPRGRLYAFERIALLLMLHSNHKRETRAK
jgi:hypothetical protein